MLAKKAAECISLLVWVIHGRDCESIVAKGFVEGSQERKEFLVGRTQIDLCALRNALKEIQVIVCDEGLFEFVLIGSRITLKQTMM